MGEMKCCRATIERGNLGAPHDSGYQLRVFLVHERDYRYIVRRRLHKVSVNIHVRTTSKYCTYMVFLYIDLPVPESRTMAMMSYFVISSRISLSLGICTPSLSKCATHIQESSFSSVGDLPCYKSTFRQPATPTPSNIPEAADNPGYPLVKKRVCGNYGGL